MNVWQKKIDDQRSVFRRVFPSKNALRTKRPVFYSPGEFTGRGSETHLHKRKVEILRFRAKRELSSNLPPKRKNRPEDRSVENFENGGVLILLFLQSHLAELRFPLTQSAHSLEVVTNSTDCSPKHTSLAWKRVWSYFRAQYDYRHLSRVEPSPYFGRKKASRKPSLCAPKIAKKGEV